MAFTTFQRFPHSSVSLQQDCFLCLNFVSPGAMEGLCEIALQLLKAWPRPWIYASIMGRVFPLQTATSYPLLLVCLFPGKSAGLISGPAQGKHITSLAVLPALSLPALKRIQQGVRERSPRWFRQAARCVWTEAQKSHTHTKTRVSQGPSQTSL